MCSGVSDGTPHSGVGLDVCGWGHFLSSPARLARDCSCCGHRGQGCGVHGEVGETKGSPLRGAHPTSRTQDAPGPCGQWNVGAAGSGDHGRTSSFTGDTGRLSRPSAQSPLVGPDIPGVYST